MDELLLLSGQPIPFPEGFTEIHQPRLKEIALIGEAKFYIATEYLTLDEKNMDTSDLSDKSDFEILMMIMNDVSLKGRTAALCVLLLLSLLFPAFDISFDTTKIILTSKEDSEFQTFIDNKNFKVFKQIVKEMFCLDRGDEDKKEYNAKGPLAKKIADKLKKRQEQLQKIKQESQKEQKVSILNRYVSILTVGEHKDMNSLLNYTVFQIYDEFERFNLKTAFDLNLQVRMAGATDVEEAENWMKDLYDKNKK